MTRNLFFFMGLVFILTLFSCQMTAPEVTGIRAPKVSSTETGKVQLDLEVRVKNPNSFGIKVKKLEGTISLGGKPLGNCTNQGKVKIKKFSEDYHAVSLQTDIDQLALLGSSLISAFMSSQMQFNIKGTGKASICLFSRKFNYEHTETIDLKQLF